MFGYCKLTDCIVGSVLTNNNDCIIQEIFVVVVDALNAKELLLSNNRSNQILKFVCVRVLNCGRGCVAEWGCDADARTPKSSMLWLRLQLRTAI